MPVVAVSVSPGAARSIAFEAFGVRVRVTGDTQAVIERVRATLPPGARLCDSSGAEVSFAVLAQDDDTYRVMRGRSAVSSGLELELALKLLETELHMYVGLHAPDSIFVHAGVVAHRGKTIVIPGLSFSGKSTLVSELVRAGAAYYSDEFAVLDQRGLVHPYPTALSLRNGSGPNGADSAPLGRPDDPPLAIGAVVFTTYRADAQWEPNRLSPGRGALAMLANTLAALERSQEAVRAITSALDGAIILEGERGEARQLSPQLLDALDDE